MPDELIPASLAEKPEPEPETLEMLQVFFALTGSRPVNMGGIGQIPVAEMLAYCEMHDIDDRPLLFRRVHAADMAFMKWQSDKANNGT